MKSKSTAAMRSFPISTPVPDALIRKNHSVSLTGWFVSGGSSLLVWIVMIWMFLEAVGG